MRASIDGSAEPWPRAQLIATRDMLAATVATWECGRGDTIDAGVNLMCRGACDLVDLELHRRDFDKWDF